MKNAIFSHIAGYLKSRVPIATSDGTFWMTFLGVCTRTVTARYRRKQGRTLHFL